MEEKDPKLDATLAGIALRKAVRDEMDEVEESPWFRWVVVFLWLSFAGILGLCWWKSHWEKYLWELLISFAAAVSFTFSNQALERLDFEFGHPAYLRGTAVLMGVTALVYVLSTLLA